MVFFLIPPHLLGGIIPDHDFFSVLSFILPDFALGHVPSLWLRSLRTFFHHHLCHHCPNHANNKGWLIRFLWELWRCRYSYLQKENEGVMLFGCCCQNVIITTKMTCKMEWLIFFYIVWVNLFFKTVPPPQVIWSVPNACMDMLIVCI